MPSTAAKTADSLLTLGMLAPDFTLTNDLGEPFSLQSCRGVNHVVLYFYPKDDTPGCTLEAKAFRDAIEQFEQCDTIIIGISKDDTASHRKFKEKYDLPFMLVTDDGDVCERYGVWKEKNMYGKKYMGIERTTLLIDKAGKIAHHWPKVKVEGHVDEVLKAAQGF